MKKYSFGTSHLSCGDVLLGNGGVVISGFRPYTTLLPRSQYFKCSKEMQLRCTHLDRRDIFDLLASHAFLHSIV